MQNYNHIKDTIDISNESGPVTEPVSLQEMNIYLRLQGFIDDNDSTSIPEFTDDDELIEEDITCARQALEEELGVSIVTHTWRAVGATNGAGNVQLMYGPVTSITSITNSEGTEYDETDEDEVKLIGDYLKYPNDCDMTVEYEAGFSDVPKPIITEIKRMVAYMYENRGDVDGLEGYKYTSAVLKYSRKSWLV
jgi:uncharacterized phiE125 gp8 family phage protein